MRAAAPTTGGSNRYSPEMFLRIIAERLGSDPAGAEVRVVAVLLTLRDLLPGDRFAAIVEELPNHGAAAGRAGGRTKPSRGAAHRLRSPRFARNGAHGAPDSARSARNGCYCGAGRRGCRSGGRDQRPRSSQGALPSIGGAAVRPGPGAGAQARCGRLVTPLRNRKVSAVWRYVGCLSARLRTL
jgi:hypothetical protein